MSTRELIAPSGNVSAHVTSVAFEKLEFSAKDSPFLFNRYMFFSLLLLSIRSSRWLCFLESIFPRRKYVRNLLIINTQLKEKNFWIIKIVYNYLILCKVYFNEIFIRNLFMQIRRDTKNWKNNHFCWGNMDWKICQIKMTLDVVLKHPIYID